jgi:hypothetical protein
MSNDYRQTFYERTGKFPRTLKTAFGPYARIKEPEPVLTDGQVFVGVLVCAVLTLALLVAGVI